MPRLTKFGFKAGKLRDWLNRPLSNLVFATIEQSVVIRRLGALDRTDREALRDGIARILGS
jgi:hypothetical protein